MYGVLTLIVRTQAAIRSILIFEQVENIWTLVRSVCCCLCCALYGHKLHLTPILNPTPEDVVH
jgi:hypothetical protein